MTLQDIYKEIMSEARCWEESGNEYEDTRELGVSEGLLLASEIVKKAMKTDETFVEGDMASNERKYVIACNEHSGNWPGVLLFWGHRTQDNESRSFGGYTSDIGGCELYSDRELKESGYHFPRFREGMTLEEFREYEDVVIEPDHLEDLGYKQIKVWYMP